MTHIAFRFLMMPVALVLAGAFSLRADSPRVPVPPLKPPQEEQATFQLHPGFKIELVASEPMISDPVALTFDHDGHLYVCEMRGYPNEGYGTGPIASGSIKRLSDRDGDGVFEAVTTFADGLRFPMGVQPWRKGVLAAVAPDILYLEDSDGDGVADIRRVMYTGFGIDNIQQLLNSLQYGLDNWVYGCNGASGGSIRCLDKPDAPPVVLGNRGLRFQPDRPGSLEPMSGGGQYGLTATANQEWFVNTNSNHLRQVVLPDHYLRRNPAQASPVPTIDIAEHGAACKVFRISPFEAWRVERTGRRAGGPDAGRFPKTELVPGGYVTSSCSPTVYEADRFPADYRRNIFICEPANNLIFRDGLVDDGAIYRSRRVDPDREFLASTDNCFRPVHLTIGPDGALYVADFYRPVIETPRSLPDDLKAQLPLQTQKRGRIWRIRPDDQVTPRWPTLSRLKSAELVPLLKEPNIWWRLNAQRLLVERNDRSVVAELRHLAVHSEHDFGRAHALWTLHGMNVLEDAEIIAAMKSDSVLLRCQALRLAEDRLQRSESVRQAAIKLADDPSIRVRFQAAFSLGEADTSEVIDALARIAHRDGRDRWVSTAVLSSAGNIAPQLLERLLANPGPNSQGVVAKLAGQVAASGSDRDLARILSAVAAQREEQQVAMLRALGEGMLHTNRPLTAIWKSPSMELKPVVAKLTGLFASAARVAADERETLVRRVSAVEQLAFGPTDIAVGALPPLLTPKQPGEVQLAAVKAISAHAHPAITTALVQAWPVAGPSLRREIQEALFARTERLPALLDAIENKTILPQQLDSARITQLRRLKDQALRTRAETLLATAVDADRQRVIDQFKSALDLKGDPIKGQAVFRKVCATCHRLDDVGVEVGPDLRAAMRDKTAEQLLVSILDPSREVDRRYTNYLVETAAGRSLSGTIASETATSITLRRAEKAEDTVLRSQIELLTDTGKSLMPDGLEQHFDKQQLADLIAYLRQVK